MKLKETKMDLTLENELDEMLSEINKEIISSESKEVTVKEETSFESLATKVLERLAGVDKTADLIHELFYNDLALKRDHSESSKIALLEALKVKMETPKTLVELAKALAKLQSAKDAKVGIQINTFKGEDIGINLSQLKGEV